MINSKIKLFLTIIISSLLLSSCMSNLDVQTLNMKAKELMDKGNIDGAIGRLESINDLNPNYSQTHYNLGIAYYKKGDYEKSVNSLTQAIKLDNKMANAYYALGIVYEDSALNEASKAKEENTLNNPEVLSNLIAYLKSSKENYSQYVNLAPNEPESANIRMRLENIDQDINKYESMLDKSAGN